MSIKYYANKVQETSSTLGTGNLVLNGATQGYKTFINAIGPDKKFTYYIYKQDNFEWEIGVGYIISSGGINQLVRERVVSSTNSNTLVGFSTGTKYIEPIISEDRVNSSFINVELKSNNFTADYIPSTYIIDSSSSNIQINLPPVSTQDDPVIIAFVLAKTIGNNYEQLGAINILPDGTETINDDASFQISILNDYVQLVSVPSQNKWIKLDPIQESTNPYGNDGAVQFKYDGSFSGVNEFVWDYSSKSLLIGNSGNATADIVLASSGQTSIFNQRLYDADFRIAGLDNSHLLYVDGGSNKISINSSSADDTLSVKADNGNGITVSKSGIGPQLTLNNSSVSGITYLNNLGSIVYSGLNTNNTPVKYAKIGAIIDSNLTANESSSVYIEILNDGSNENVAVFSPSGITLGFNNSNLDGTIIGGTSSNEGNNVVLGYYNNVCGENCVVLGDNSVVSSGTFGGSIGSEHAVSGTNIWVLGGSGVSVSGNNKVYVAIDNNNYIAMLNSGNLQYNTLSYTGNNFSIKNEALASSGSNQSISFIFNNVSGTAKTGLSINNIVDNASISEESSRIKASIMVDGSPTQVMDLGKHNVVIGKNTYSDKNIIYGQNNNISNTGNLLFGSNIFGSGTENVLFGNNIVCSGINSSIIGQNNSCTNIGDANIVVIGNNNEASQDHVVSIGSYNANSGLRSVSCGYSNGSHGEYAISVGSYNLVDGNGSIAIGRNNNVSTTDIYGNVFSLGIGNESEISNTGLLIGFQNELYGSGGIVVGTDCWVSGNNNIVIGDNIVYSGNDTVLLSGLSTILYGSVVSISGSNSAILQSSNLHRLIVTPTGTHINGPSGIQVSGSTIDMTGIDVTISGTNLNFVGTDGVSVSGDMQIESTETIIHSTGLIKFYADSNNSINILSTGVAISGSSIENFVNSTNYIRLANTGLIIKSSEAFVEFGTKANSLVDDKDINIYGDLKVTAQVGGSGIFYENIPVATGIASGLVIEDNVIKKIAPGNTSDHTMGVNVITPASADDILLFGCDDPSYTKKYQFIDITSLTSVNLILYPTLSVLPNTCSEVEPTFVDGFDYYVRNISTNPTADALLVYDNTGNLLCTLGGGTTDNLSCHLVLNVVSPGTYVWRIVSLNK